MRPARPLLVLLAALLAVGAALALARVLLPEHALVSRLQLGWDAALALLALAALVDSLVRGPARSITVQRTVPSSVAIDVAVPVQLALRHASRSALRVAVTEHTDARLACEGLPHELRLASGGTTTLDYRLLPCVRGDAQLGPVELRVRSPWGLWDFRLRPLGADAVRVYPNFSPLARLAGLSIEQQVLRIGVHLQARRGEGTDFHELREFRPGDTLRQIDWKATARLRKTISREYRDERDQRVVFLLDCGSRLHAVDGESSHFDAAVDAVLLAAHVAVKHGDAVGLLTFSGEPRWLPPRKGAAQVRALLNALFDLESSTRGADYLEAARSLAVRLTRRALVVVVTNLRDVDAGDLAPALELLARRHFVVLASLAESAMGAALRAPVNTLGDALRVASIHSYLAERRRALDALSKTAALRVDCEPEKLGIAMVNAYLEVKAAGRL